MSYRVIDLFCGIGGFHQAFAASGCDVVMASDIDKFARKAYEHNYPDTQFVGDITSIASADIPDFDILAGGFPCQAFSAAGVSTNNFLGRSHGFSDKTRGTLFFEVARIIRDRSPQAFVLENVKNLMRHDKGRTFDTILHTLETELGYTVHHKVVSSAGLVPQKRERTFIVGFRAGEAGERFVWPSFGDMENGPRLSSILEENVDAKYTLSDRLWQWLQDHAAKHASKGAGFGYGLVTPEDVARTISARYGKDGSEILIAQDGKNPRKLTPREALRLQGFPKSFEIVCSDTQTWKQAGNSVAVPVVAKIAQSVVENLNAYKGFSLAA